MIPQTVGCLETGTRENEITQVWEREEGGGGGRTEGVREGEEGEERREGEEGE